MNAPSTCTAFAGATAIATGRYDEVAASLHAMKLANPDDTSAANATVFDNNSGRQFDFDLSGTAERVVKRALLLNETGLPGQPQPEAPTAPRGRGRPKLGVVAHEVTLLPRQWDWLRTQPGGASAALRRLVDQARKSSRGEDQRRQATDAAYRFATSMAGNLPGFEEALRALYAGDASRFQAETADWPADVAEFARRLAAPALS